MIVLVANRRDNIVHGVVVVGWKEGEVHFFSFTYIVNLLIEGGADDECDVITCGWIAPSRPST